MPQVTATPLNPNLRKGHFRCPRPCITEKSLQTVRGKSIIVETLPSSLQKSAGVKIWKELYFSRNTGQETSRQFYLRKEDFDLGWREVALSPCPGVVGIVTSVGTHLEARAHFHSRTLEEHNITSPRGVALSPHESLSQIRILPSPSLLDSRGFNLNHWEKYSGQRGIAKNHTSSKLLCGASLPTTLLVLHRYMCNELLSFPSFSILSHLLSRHYKEQRLEPRWWHKV